jgi:outer membrane murein-binding lipoprotein Lpp
MRRIMVMVFVAGCVSAPPPSSSRWPGHRKAGDQRFADLERRASELETKVAALTKELAETRAMLAARVLDTAPAAAPPR